MRRGGWQGGGESKGKEKVRAGTTKRENHLERKEREFVGG